MLILRLIKNNNDHFAIQGEDGQGGWKRISRWFSARPRAVEYAQELFDKADNAERERQISVLETYSGSTT